MNKGGKFSKKIQWISFISRRFSSVDRKGRSAVTSTLAVLGICFGVMTLISVMSVMNGFQMSFIDSIIEISSFHIQAEGFWENEKNQLLEECRKNKNIRSQSCFMEAQALMSGKKNRETAGIIRAVDKDIYESDYGFNSEVRMLSGQFDLEEKDSIILGSGLARSLGVKTGDKVNLLVMSGGSDVDLFSENRVFNVKGIFSSGYAEINSSYCFISYEDGILNFGKNAPEILGIKLKDSASLSHTLYTLKKKFPALKITSWREYNKSFYGALRIEKNMLLLLVAMIFLVVAVNIYNGMRRLVFERKNEIAILSALGGTREDIKLIFILRGFFTGLAGSVSGVILGLFISVNTKTVFELAAKLLYLCSYIFTAVTSPENLQLVNENATFMVYASIPARIYVGEVVMIAVFGIAAPLLASLAASRNVLKMTVSEVLHDE